MKIKVLLCFLLLAFQLQAQSFSTYNFLTDGYPVSAAFPASPSRSVKVSKSDTLLTATAAQSGTTYSLIVTRTASDEIARRSAQSFPGRLLAKASQHQTTTSSTITGIASTYLKYVSGKGTYITAHVFSWGRMMCHVMVLRKSEYADDVQTTIFFNSINFQQLNSPAGSTVTLYPSASSDNEYKKGNRVEVWDSKTNKWFGAIILKVHSNNIYKVAFDGYADTYDEDVPANRIRKMTTSTIPSFVPYITTEKGRKTIVEGNLQTGKIIEDLSWATSSQIACWPSIRDVEFQGNHVGYWFDLPANSIVTITVTPKHSTSRINIYGYTSFDLQRVPPNITYVQSCEASHPTWIGEPNLQEPAKPQSIQLNTVTRHTTVYFAVAGAKNILSGDYTITIDIK